MDKHNFYIIQAKAFREYAVKYSEAKLFPLFSKWCCTKDIVGIDKEEIWRIARRMRTPERMIIEEGDEGFVRLSAVLDILLQTDLAYLGEIMENKQNSIDKT